MMQLTFLDWGIIIVYLVFSGWIALRYSKKAGASLTDYFLSGRELPWWIAGTTMVATTFAADTPLTVTELVAQHGIAGNWLWWNMLLGGMFTVFFYARLWRRAGIMTDVEFVELRYSGKPAAFLRGFRALYLGIFMNVIIMGWVNLAMVKILTVLFPEVTFLGVRSISFMGLTFSAALLWVGVIMVLVAIYSGMAGLWGVSITDVFQFTIAMTGSVLLAIYALNSPEVGGISGLREKLPQWVFRMVPAMGESSGSIGIFKLSLLSFIAYLGVQWWASWYPGAEPGGGGYIAQRMMSAKDERHSLFATLWFNVAHYALRPWPWILVALSSLVMFPELSAAQKGEGFVMVMVNVLPAGILGLLIAAFLAAYMSTISTQLNWGTSYIIHDFYQRYFQPGADEKTLVHWSRITTGLVMALSLIVTSRLDRISDAWIFILECSAGIGLVLMLRWFWWRINAWSEITAMVAPFFIYPWVKAHTEFPVSLFYIVLWSTFWWVVVTFLTRPTEQHQLLKFYRRIHPGGRGWRPIADQAPDVSPDRGYGPLFAAWILGSILVYTILFAIGHLLMGNTTTGLILLLLSGGMVWGISRLISVMDWSLE
ncbi:MAG: Na+:solute symporter [FCB group bacterium]|nr:Na+:solute symporter [FCB group bacterium]